VRKMNPGQVPIQFELPYTPRRIDSHRTYVVRANIRDGGRVRFTGDRAHPVLTKGHGATVAIMMSGAQAIGGWGEGSVQPGPAPPLKVPATYAGLLPCADCSGIRYQVNLLPNGAYMQRATYLRDGHDDSYYEVGAWSRSKDGYTLTLEADRKARAFWEVKSSQTLRKLDTQGRRIDSKVPYELVRSAELVPLSPRVRMQGTFRYMADAARFRDCRSGLQWPVAMTDDYRELESAYTSGQVSPGSDLLVWVQGRIEPMRRVEGTGTEPTLVIEKFVSARPGENCEGGKPREAHAAAAAAPGLENYRWRPVKIGDVAVAGHDREPWIELDAKSKRVTGSGGCNRLAGSYTKGDGTLRFGPLVSTRMACPAMKTETAFLKALDATRRYRVKGRTLELSNRKGATLARLEISR
jgi:copper homeostasis protein (lipoprotein)